jgi:hypothetical protein
MKKIVFAVAFSIVIVVLVVASAFAQSSVEWPFDNSSDGWSCAWFGGYLAPDPLCASPVQSGPFQTVGAVVFAVADTGGVLTARFVDALGSQHCISHLSLAAGASGRLDLICGAFRGDLKLEIIEGSGSWLVDFVRLDLTRSVPTATATLVPSPTPFPSPTPYPTPYPVYPSYPAGGSYSVGSVIPPTPSPTPIVDCRVYIRIYEAAGVLYDLPVDVEFLSDRTASFNVSGFAVLTAPCGESFVSVRDKSGLLLSDPFFVAISPMDSLDLGVRAAPAPTPIPSPLPEEVSSDSSFPGFDFSLLAPVPSGAVSVSTTADRDPVPSPTPIPSPVSEEVSSSLSPSPSRASFLPAWADWPPLVGIAVFGLLILRVVAFVRSRRQ